MIKLLKKKTKKNQATVTTQYVEEQRIQVLPKPPHSFHLLQRDFSIFGKLLTTNLAGNTFHAFRISQKQ